MNPFKPLTRWLPFLALLLMTAAYYAIPWQSAPWLAAVVGVPFLLCYCVLFPGYSLVRRFGDPSSGAIERVAWAAFSGFAVLLACAFVWALSGVSLATFTGVLPIVTVAVTLTARGGFARRGDPPANPPGASSRWGLAVAALVVLMGLLVLLTGPPTGYSSDTIDYIAYTNEVARTGDPFPTSEFYLDAGANGADLRKGLLHSLYGYFKWYLGIDTLVLFRWLGAAFLALVMLAVYTAARAFFPGRAVAALSVVFFVLGFDGGLDSPLIRSFFYPGRFAVGYLLLFLVVALDFVTRPRPKSLVWCSIFAFAAAAVHIQYAVLIGFVAGTILLWKTCFNAGSWREHLVRSSSLGLAAFMGMLPYAAFRYLTAFQSGGASDLHRQIQGAMFVSDRLFIANPLTAWQGAGLFGLAAAMAVIPLWPRRREYPALGYLIASMLTVVLIQFNPLFMPLFYSAITYLVYRLGIICPYYILAAYFLVTAVRGAATGSPPWGPLRRVVLAVTAIAVVAGLSPALTRNAFSPATIAAERETGYPRWKDGLSKLGELPGRAVIASDPVTSYMISAFTPHFVVCTFDQHAPPSDLLSRERSIAARDILSPFTSSSDKGHQIAKHRVTHVVVNENLDVTDRSDFWTVGKESAPLVRGRLGALSDMFIEEGAVGGLRLYRTAGNAPRHVAAVQNPLLRRRIPPDAAKVGETAGLARLEAARIAAPDTVRGGDEIEVTLYWLRQEELPLDKYVVTIRFDRTDVELPFGGKPFPKIARKLKERINGERYRFRHDHQIVDGFVSPDTWPPSVFVVDRTVVRIPAYAAAGRYEVRARLITGSTAPNYRMRDFLYDDDIYQGVVIGEITTGR